MVMCSIVFFLEEPGAILMDVRRIYIAQLFATWQFVISSTDVSFCKGRAINLELWNGFFFQTGTNILDQFWFQLMHHNFTLL